MPKRYRKNVLKRYLTTLKCQSEKLQYLLNGKSFRNQIEEMGGVVEGMRVVAAEMSKKTDIDGIEARSYCFQVQPVTCQHFFRFIFFNLFFFFNLFMDGLV